MGWKSFYPSDDGAQIYYGWSSGSGGGLSVWANPAHKLSMDTWASIISSHRHHLPLRYPPYFMADDYRQLRIVVLAEGATVPPADPPLYAWNGHEFDWRFNLRDMYYGETSDIVSGMWMVTPDDWDVYLDIEPPPVGAIPLRPYPGGEYYKYCVLLAAPEQHAFYWYSKVDLSDGGSVYEMPLEFYGQSYLSPYFMEAIPNAYSGICVKLVFPSDISIDQIDALGINLGVSADSDGADLLIYNHDTGAFVEYYTQMSDCISTTYYSQFDALSAIPFTPAFIRDRTVYILARSHSVNTNIRLRYARGRVSYPRLDLPLKQLAFGIGAGHAMTALVTELEFEQPVYQISIEAEESLSNPYAILHQGVPEWIIGISMWGLSWHVWNTDTEAIDYYDFNARDIPPGFDHTDYAIPLAESSPGIYTATLSTELGDSVPPTGVYHEALWDGTNLNSFTDTEVVLAYHAPRHYWWVRGGPLGNRLVRRRASATYWPGDPLPDSEIDSNGWYYRLSAATITDPFTMPVTVSSVPREHLATISVDDSNYITWCGQAYPAHTYPGILLCNQAIEEDPARVRQILLTLKFWVKPWNVGYPIRTYLLTSDVPDGDTYWVLLGTEYFPYEGYDYVGEVTYDVTQGAHAHYFQHEAVLFAHNAPVTMTIFGYWEPAHCLRLAYAEWQYYFK